MVRQRTENRGRTTVAGTEPPAAPRLPDRELAQNKHNLGRSAAKQGRSENAQLVAVLVPEEGAEPTRGVEA